MTREASVQKMGQCVDLAVNQHILFEVATTTQEQADYALLLLNKPDMCLAEALVIAYVLNNGVVMCSNGLDDASHGAATLGRPSDTLNDDARQEATLGVFETPADSLSGAEAATETEDLPETCSGEELQMNLFEKELDLLTLQ